MRGVEFILNTHVVGATPNSVKLDDDKNTIIPCYALIWTAGVTPGKLIADLPCEHDKGHRIIANNYLEIPGYDGVYVLGDCASITIHIQESLILQQHSMQLDRAKWLQKIYLLQLREKQTRRQNLIIKQKE